MNCERCGEKLDEEEAESPQRDRDGDIICDECFELKYTYICPICREMFNEDFSKEISPEYFLVSEDTSEDLNLTPGIYEITSYPFYADSMIEIHIFKTAVNKIADLPKGTYEDDTQYVCSNCAERIMHSKGE